MINTGQNINLFGTQIVGGVNYSLNNNEGGTLCKDLALPERQIVGKKFEENFEKIVGWLSLSQPNVMGVHGMAGVGKTTLLKHVHNHLLEVTNNIAQRVCWVTVSQNCDVFKLQLKIAKAIGIIDFNEEDPERSAAALSNKLKEMGKVVLILDDIWVHYDVVEVGIPVDEDNCKIVISTRKKEVCRQMDCDDCYILHVETLLPGEAWDLFVATLNNREQLRFPIEVAKQVAGECGCLPLALIHVATSMKGVASVHEWQNALNELKHPIRMPDHLSKNKVFRSLYFSYDHLSNEIEKRCFLTCILYSEDDAIRIEKLIEIWMWEGLLLEIAGSKRDDQVNKGHAIINKLLDSCLIILSKFIRCVSMHDLVRDMGILITKSVPRFIAEVGLHLEEIPEGKHWTHDLANVSLRHNKIQVIPPHMAPNCPQLTLLTLYMNPLREIPNSFFVYLKPLRVLDLSYTDIQGLPESVSGLVHLRALLLITCRYLEYVPSLQCVTKLKALCLAGSDKVRAPTGLGRLRELERMEFCRWPTIDMIDFNEFVGSQTIQYLSSYYFILGDSQRGYIGDDRKFVRIIGAKLSQTQSTISLPDTVEEVLITDCEFVMGDVFPGVSGASTLARLDIVDCSGLEYVLRAEGASSFCQLQMLILYDLADVKGIIIMMESGGRNETQLASNTPLSSPASTTFSNLIYLRIVNCPKMKVLFPAWLLQLQPVLPSLDTLSVSGCEKMKVIFESPVGVAFNYTAANFILSLPQLEEVSLHGLPELKSICRGLLFCKCSFELDINDCPKLNLVASMKSLICDDSVSTLASIPTPTQDPQWWDILRKHHPYDAHTLEQIKLRGVNNGESSNQKKEKKATDKRGLLFCNSEGQPGASDYPKLELAGSSMKSLICDGLESTLAFIPTTTKDPQKHHQHDVDTLHHGRKRKAEVASSSSPCSEDLISIDDSVIKRRESNTLFNQIWEKLISLWRRLKLVLTSDAQLHQPDDADTLHHHLLNHYQPPHHVARKCKEKEVASSSSVDFICYDQQSSEDLKTEDGALPKKKKKKN